MASEQEQDAIDTNNLTIEFDSEDEDATDIGLTHIEEVAIEVGRPSFIKALKPKKVVVVSPNAIYMPNMQALKPSGSNYISRNNFDVVPFCAQRFRHDAAALANLIGNVCVTFNIPNNIFARHAPLHKITFLPQNLLPSGYNAGGIFGPGVLPRKFYPNGLLQKHHTGPTPALFVGHRVQPELLVGPSGIGLSEYPALPENAALKSSSVSIALSVSPKEIICRLPDLLRNKALTTINEYLPNLSKVGFNPSRPSKMIYALLSTVLQPHEPIQYDPAAVPRFPLPEAVLPANGQLVEPVWLPKCYLPKYFDAGCVFPPNCMALDYFPEELLYSCVHPQHSSVIIPPTFLGLWNQKYWPVCLNATGEIMPEPSLVILPPPRTPRRARALTPPPSTAAVPALTEARTPPCTCGRKQPKTPPPILPILPTPTPSPTALGKPSSTCRRTRSALSKSMAQMKPLHLLYVKGDRRDLDNALKAIDREHIDLRCVDDAEGLDLVTAFSQLNRLLANKEAIKANMIQPQQLRRVSQEEQPAQAPRRTEPKK